MTFGGTFGGGGGGGGGADPSDIQRLAFADAAATGDPLTLLSSAASAGSVTGTVQFPMKTGITADTPNEYAFVEWSLTDVDGGALTSLRVGEAWYAVLQLIDDEVAVGTRLGLALTEGGMAAPGQGLFIGVERHALGWFAQLSTFVSSWAAITNASVADRLAREWAMKALRGNSDTNIRLGLESRDASGRVTSFSNSAPAPPSVTAGGDYTRLALLVGTDNASTAAQTVTVAAKLWAVDITSRASHTRKDLETPSPIDVSAATTVNIGFLGHSIMTGTEADADKGGNAVNSGWTLTDDGSSSANWPNSGGRHASIMPYVVDELESQSATGGTLIRRSTNGQELVASNADTDLGDLIDDFTSAGVDPDILFVWYGANDAQAGEAADYNTRLQSLVTNVRYQWPDCIIVLLGERTTTGAAYPELDTVNGHKSAVATANAAICIYEPDPDDASWILTDAIHYSAGASGGFAAIAVDAVASLVAAF